MAKSAEEEREERLRSLLERVRISSGISELLDSAFVHESAARPLGIRSNERLEFLGDAILGLVVALWLYENFPDEAEGVLSKRKGAIVSGAAIARTAARLGFSDILRLGTGERAAGGHELPSILGGAFEAFVAAVFLDHGFEAARRLIEREHIAHVDHEHAALTDPKSQLQEKVQAISERVPEYNETFEGPAHARTFTSVVTVGGKILGKGSGPSKKAAQQDAAAEALRELDKAP